MIPQAAALIWLLTVGVAAEMTLVDVNYIVCQESVVAIPFNVESPEDPYIVTFWRTSKRAVSVTFSLTPTGDSTNLVIPEITIDLTDHTVRRLEILPPMSRRPEMWKSKARRAQAPPEPVEAVGHRLCEGVYLFDGREPVDIPETWRAARADFTRMCEAELGHHSDCGSKTLEMFSETPDDDTPFSPDGALCEALSAFVREEFSGGAEVKMLGRRLKSTGGGGGGGGGGGLAQSYSPRSQAYSDGTRASYGFTSSGIQSTYPNGYLRSGYGYTGRNMWLGAVVGGFRVRTLYSPEYDGSRVYTKAANSSGVAPSDGGTMQWITTEEFVRDDIMEYGFFPDEVDESESATAFTLYITAISGADFAAERICPPAYWSLSNPSGWTAPDSQDLFVDLSMMATEEFPVWAIVLIVVGGFLICCCFPCLVAFCVRRRRRRRQAQITALNGQQTEAGPVVFGSPATDVRWAQEVPITGRVVDEPNDTVVTSIPATVKDTE